MVAGKRRDMGLGGFPDVTLAGAKEAARVARAKISDGIDPIGDRKKLRSDLQAARASSMTFTDAAKAYIASKEVEWTNAKHGDQWRNTLATHVEPIIGGVFVSELDHSHIVRVLEPIWLTKTETATRVRGRIEKILDWAKAGKYRTGDNPARWQGHLSALLPSPSKFQKVAHHAALPFIEIGAFMAILRQQDGMGAKALEFAILTAARSGEVRGATWAEVDLKAATWTIPAERMKIKDNGDHRVPLNAQAIALLKTMPDSGELIFPSTKGGMLSDMTLTSVLRRMKRGDITVHGFRSTFRDWASECTNYPREAAELALAHGIEDQTEAAYRRGDLFQKRILMMRDWGKFSGKVQVAGTVTPIKAKARA